MRSLKFYGSTLGSLTLMLFTTVAFANPLWNKIPYEFWARYGFGVLIFSGFLFMICLFAGILYVARR